MIDGSPKIYRINRFQSNQIKSNLRGPPVRIITNSTMKQRKNEEEEEERAKKNKKKNNRFFISKI